ncbi:MAG: epoxyqueuosine reductase [Firmicutes bacterium]|nr:epoxyqueuosine reductase [Bacillota bacterium]
MDQATAIRERALQLGYSKCGIINVDEVKGYQEKLAARIAAFPESAVMYSRFYPFADVRQKFPWAKSLVVCIRGYGKYKIPAGLRGHIATAYLFDSRKDQASEGYQARENLIAHLESSGIKVGYEVSGITAARFAAQKAGLGKIRTNNFFYTAEDGSWNRIEVFAIDKELELIEQSPLQECPAGCRECIEACPTKSLTEPLTMHPFRCVSFLTTLGAEQTELAGNPLAKGCGSWIYGCDECQKACPMNHGCFKEETDFPNLATIADNFSLEKIIDMDDEFYLRVMQPKFWYLGPEQKWLWKVNALNAMLNSGQEKFQPYLQKCLHDPNERVRRMAKWAGEVSGLL